MGGSASNAPAARNAATAAPAGFAGASENAGNMLGSNLDPSDQDNSGYGYGQMVGQGHNGAGTEFH